ncbi:Bax inhibitor-1/YccA family membrane protein [Corynebacterium meridianum]|uniref:Bax inhibitor-1/YccA family protein n=1 Tax=Corynebacterium meridianum TaxID=2765363 RepID=A0A934M6C2_9CORY|nr:Bax inhibitor-1/YccA family protein [Corynebacterium meridianum]MCK7678063.1 Bax inhibitor-1/YccA family protein [Corynebacterium meridianum]
MRSSNPVLSSLTGNRNQPQPNPYQTGYPQAGYQDPYLAQQGGSPDAQRPITVDDIVTKTGIMLGIIVAVAVVNFLIGTMINPGLAMLLTIVGAIGGLVTVLIFSFGRKYGSAPIALTYAAFEGLFVGGISLMFSGVLVGGANAGAMIGQAVLGTVGVFLGMLYVYKSGAVKVTPKFTRILVGCMVGVLILIVGNMLMSMFTSFNVLRDGGPIAIIFSLVCIVLAAMSFLVDFDSADKLVRAGAPANMAWGVALGLAVTLVWLYTEILRLLSYFNNR